MDKTVMFIRWFFFLRAEFVVVVVVYVCVYASVSLHRKICFRKMFRVLFLADG